MKVPRAIAIAHDPRPRINRAPLPVLAVGLPWVSVMLGSFVPAFALIASAPLLPPFGFLAFIAWRQLRPGLLPIWAGLPLGLFDDLYSGQPFGAGILLFSVAAIVLELIEARLPWRNFLTEWLIGAGLIAGYVLLGLAFANIAGGSAAITTIVPQLVASLLAYPLVGRMVAATDRFRLLPFRELR